MDAVEQLLTKLLSFNRNTEATQHSSSGNMLIDISAYNSGSPREDHVWCFEAVEICDKMRYLAFKTAVGLMTDSSKKKEGHQIMVVSQRMAGAQSSCWQNNETLRDLTLDFLGEWFFFVSGRIDCVLEIVLSLPGSSLLGSEVKTQHLAVHCGGFFCDSFLHVAFLLCIITKHAGP